jgi:hypothetical protein
MNEFSSKKSRSTSPSRSSLTEVEDEERDSLLETMHLGEKKRSGENGARKVRRTRSFYAICILSLSNLAFIVAIFTILYQKKTFEPNWLPSWAPPERYESRVFQYVDIYGGEPGPKSEAAWTNLIPSEFIQTLLIFNSITLTVYLSVSVGKGWIEIHNETAIPDTPGLDQSLPKQSALVSVFHQLHCLVSTGAIHYPSIREAVVRQHSN